LFHIQSPHFQYPILVCSCKSFNWYYSPTPTPIAFRLFKSHIPLYISVFTLHFPFVVDNRLIIRHKAYCIFQISPQVGCRGSVPSCPHLKITQPLFILFPVYWAHDICLALKHWDGAFGDIPTDNPTQHMVIAMQQTASANRPIVRYN